MPIPPPGSGRVTAARARHRAPDGFAYSKKSANRTSDISSLFRPSVFISPSLPSPPPSFRPPCASHVFFWRPLCVISPRFMKKLDALSLPAAADKQMTACGEEKKREKPEFFLTGMLKAGGVSLPRRPTVAVLISAPVEIRLSPCRSVEWSLYNSQSDQSGRLDVGSIRHRQQSRLQDVRPKFSQPRPSR